MIFCILKKIGKKVSRNANEVAQLLFALLILIAPPAIIYFVIRWLFGANMANFVVLLVVLAVLWLAIAKVIQNIWVSFKSIIAECKKGR